MARKRMIDPAIWADEDFGTMPAEDQVFFIGLFSNADDEGRLPGNALYLASVIFPYKGYSKEQAIKVRDRVLKTMKSATLYVVDGKEYIQLQKWTNYQSINKPTQSNYPPLTEDSRSTTVGLPPNRIEKNRIEKNMVGGGERYGSENVNQILDAFKKLYGFNPTDKYPRRVAHNLDQQLSTLLKKRGKDPSNGVKTKAINDYFMWVSRQDWAEKIQNLDTIRRKISIFEAELPEVK